MDARPLCSSLFDGSDMKVKALYFLLSLFIPLLVLLPRPALSTERDAGPKGTTHVEEYHYEAVPIGEEDDTEQIEAVLSLEDNGIVFFSKNVSRKAEEQTLVNMTAGGDLISATRSVTDRSGSLTEARIWRDADKVHVERTSGEGKNTTVLTVPKGVTPAVEASLIVLFRCFPCELATPWDLLIIDFSGRSVSATARQVGVERITVPAGAFACYRMEVTFHLLILRPEVVCWVTQENPHVLVKSVGKRGLFSPTYVTSLIGRKVPAPPARKTDGKTQR